MFLSIDRMVTLSWILVVCMGLCAGCGGGTEPATTTGSELSNYLAENPELAEVVEEEEIDPADVQE